MILRWEKYQDFQCVETPLNTSAPTRCPPTVQSVGAAGEAACRSQTELNLRRRKNIGGLKGEQSIKSDTEPVKKLGEKKKTGDVGNRRG
jgi:hypothetical protein